MFKKTIVGVLALSFLMSSVSIPAYAAEDCVTSAITEKDIESVMQEKVPNMLSVWENDPECFGLTNDYVENSYLGEKFYISDNEGNENRNVIYYPIIGDGDVRGILTLTKIDGEISINLSTSFASKLNDVLHEVNSVSLFSCDDGIYACDGAGKTYDVSVNNGESDFSSISISDKEISRLKKADNISIQSLNSDAVSFNNLIDEENEISTYTSSGSTGKVLNKYVKVGQGNLNICWAATIASIAKYKLPTKYGTLTAVGVCNKYGIELKGQPNSVSCNYLNRLFLDGGSYYVAKCVDRPLTKEETIDNINNDRPIFLGATGLDSRGESKGHAVAVCGYYFADSSSYCLRLMNPNLNDNEGGFELTNIPYSGNISFGGKNGSILYHWTDSIVFD